MCCFDHNNELQRLDVQRSIRQMARMNPRHHRHNCSPVVTAVTLCRTNSLTQAAEPLLPVPTLSPARYASFLPPELKYEKLKVVFANDGTR